MDYFLDKLRLFMKMNSLMRSHVKWAFLKCGLPEESKYVVGILTNAFHNELLDWQREKELGGRWKG